MNINSEYLNIVEELKRVAESSTCNKLHVGACVINKYGDIASWGWNGAPKKQPQCNEIGCLLDPLGRCIRTIHSEMNALLRAPAEYGSRLYSTHMPCIRCSQLAINFGVVEVVYLIEYVDVLAHLFGVENQKQYLENAGICVRKIPDIV